MGNSLSFDDYFNGETDGRKGTFETIIRPNNNNNNNNNNEDVLSPDTEVDARRKIYTQRIVDELEEKGQKQKLHELDRKKHHSAVIIQKYWKGYSQRRKWNMFLCKSRVLKELLSTEKDYVQFMEIIMDIYFKPLEDLVRPQLTSSMSTNNIVIGKERASSVSTNSQSRENSIGSSSNTSSNNVNSSEKDREGSIGGSKDEHSSAISSMKPEIQKEFSFLEQTPLTLEEIKIVFSQIEVIRMYNSKLLEKIQQRLADIWDDSIRIGDVFLEMIDFLKVPYSHYIMNFPACLKVLENASKRPSYMLFIQQCKSIDKVARRDLQSFVSMPIQRIPRYVLLLRELLKFTHPSHPDYENIYKALRRMEAIAELINRQMREDEHSKVVMSIAQKLKPTVESLIQPHRRLIREGEAKIIKTDGNNHEAQYATIKPSSIPFNQNSKISIRYFYLFNDMFIITKKMKTYYKVEKVISLQYSTVVDHYVKRSERQSLNSSSNNSNNNNNVNNNSNSNNNVKSPSKDVNSINNMIVSLKNNNNNNNNNNSNNEESESVGERHFFKLHSLDCAVVICLSTEAEKIMWKNDFISVINQITENSISFNPKWSRNNLIFGEEKIKKSDHKKQRQSIISPENFKLKQSISELLAVEQPNPKAEAKHYNSPSTPSTLLNKDNGNKANDTPYKPRSISVCEPESTDDEHPSDASYDEDDSDTSSNNTNSNNNDNNNTKQRSYSVSAVETLSPFDRILKILR